MMGEERQDVILQKETEGTKAVSQGVLTADCADFRGTVWGRGSRRDKFTTPASTFAKAMVVRSRDAQNLSTTWPRWSVFWGSLRQRVGVVCFLLL